jgi:hypothetical protein
MLEFHCELPPRSTFDERYWLRLRGRLNDDQVAVNANDRGRDAAAAKPEHCGAETTP